MGQVGEIFTCPIFILAKSQVQTLYEQDSLAQPGGSKNLAVNVSFSGKIEPTISLFLIVGACS